MKCEAVIAGLASEGLALILDSAEAGSSAVVGPTPTDPVEFQKSARDLKALSAAKEYINEERGGGRDPVCFFFFFHIFVTLLSTRFSCKKFLVHLLNLVFKFGHLATKFVCISAPERCAVQQFHSSPY